MKLADLKQKATASELTLIDAVETALREEVARDLKKRLGEFLLKNPPPDREIMRFQPDMMRDWSTHLNKHLGLETP